MFYHVNMSPIKHFGSKYVNTTRYGHLTTDQQTSPPYDTDAPTLQDRRTHITRQTCSHNKPYFPPYMTDKSISQDRQPHLTRRTCPHYKTDLPTLQDRFVHLLTNRLAHFLTDTYTDLSIDQSTDRHTFLLVVITAKKSNNYVEYIILSYCNAYSKLCISIRRIDN